MALIPVRPLYSASATATNGSDIIQVTGNVDCSFMSSGSIVSLGTRQLTDAISGTAPDLSGNSTIKLRRPWSDPTTTAPLLAFMSREGLADAVARLRQIIDAQEGTLQGAFSFMGAWDASSGSFPPAPGEGLGSQMYRVSAAGTMGGRPYRVGEPLYYDQFTSQWRSFFELATAFSSNLLLQADAAAWRTALDLVKTTSATDGTLGRMLKVGDFGVGSITMSSGLLLSTQDITANRASGKYRYSSNCLNKPDSSNGFIEVISRDPNNYTIRAVTDIGGLFEYTMSNGLVALGGWQGFYTNKNILGTVSQSGGVPTGAIIQRGSNANGSFVRFADGTQICTRTLSISSYPVNTPFGSIYLGESVSLGSYAASFAGLEHCSVSFHATAAASLIHVQQTGPTLTNWPLIAGGRGTADAVRSVIARGFAIGRWF